MTKILMVYPVPEGGGDIQMPKDAKIVDAASIEGIVSVLAIVDMHSLHVPHRVTTAAIGQKVTDGYRCIRVLANTVAVQRQMGADPEEVTFVMGIFDGGENPGIPAPIIHLNKS